MKRHSWSNREKISVLLVMLGTAMVVGSGINGKIESQIAGLVMCVGGALALLQFRLRKAESRFRHHS